MRMAVITLGIAGALVVSTRPGSAQQVPNYPWCLNAGGSDSNFTSCAFDTFGQCMATGWGDGGVCFRNPAYRPGIERPLPRRRRG
jgi:hypothetical protein